ncbi:hypothetical protein [Bradyrhizobium algeriense]|uniref:hypothetical protein n=1 Tax=Bradyrhizobium algeriense TaxID=634784 RepID=UPI0011AE97B2|nr:hypothetical protein [Bradyrhizobium algeriense]
MKPAKGNEKKMEARRLRAQSTVGSLSLSPEDHTAPRQKVMENDSDQEKKINAAGNSFPSQARNSPARTMSRIPASLFGRFGPALAAPERALESASV